MYIHGTLQGSNDLGRDFIANMSIQRKIKQCKIEMYT